MSPSMSGGCGYGNSKVLIIKFNLSVELIITSDKKILNSCWNDDTLIKTWIIFDEVMLIACEFCNII